jgi:hypothetical protein
VPASPALWGFVPSRAAASGTAHLRSPAYAGPELARSGSRATLEEAYDCDTKRALRLPKNACHNPVGYPGERVTALRQAFSPNRKGPAFLHEGRPEPSAWRCLWWSQGWLPPRPPAPSLPGKR